MSYEEPVYGETAYHQPPPVYGTPPPRRSDAFDRLSPRRRQALIVGGGVLLLFLVLLAVAALAHNSNLYPADIHGRVGYINSSGDVRIQPQFAEHLPRRSPIVGYG